MTVKAGDMVKEGRPIAGARWIEMDHTEQLLNVFAQAEASELQGGIAWYADAHNQALALAVRYDLPLDVVVGVIAALSPNVLWSRNVVDAALMIAAHVAGEDPEMVRVSAYGPNRAKAARILRGESPADVLRGPKVPSFYQCIMEPETWDAVCIDGHAICIWLGEKQALSNNRGTLKAIQDCVPAVSHIADSYRQAAAVVGMRPCEFQAVTWLVWRRLHPETSRSEKRVS